MAILWKKPNPINTLCADNCYLVLLMPGGVFCFVCFVFCIYTWLWSGLVLSQLQSNLVWYSYSVKLFLFNIGSLWPSYWLPDQLPTVRDHFFVLFCFVSHFLSLSLFPSSFPSFFFSPFLLALCWISPSISSLSPECASLPLHPAPPPPALTQCCILWVSMLVQLLCSFYTCSLCYTIHFHNFNSCLYTHALPICVSPTLFFLTSNFYIQYPVRWHYLDSLSNIFTSTSTEFKLSSLLLNHYLLSEVPVVLENLIYQNWI